MNPIIRKILEWHLWLANKDLRHLTEAQLKTPRDWRADAMIETRKEIAALEEALKEEKTK